MLLRGSGGAADAISRCFDLLPQPPAGSGEQGTAEVGAGAEEVEGVRAEDTEEAEAEDAETSPEAKRLGLSRGDEVRANKVSVEAELDPRYEAKRDDLRAIMLHAGGGNPNPNSNPNSNPNPNPNPNPTPNQAGGWGGRCSSPSTAMPRRSSTSSCSRPCSRC